MNFNIATNSYSLFAEENYKLNVADFPDVEIKLTDFSQEAQPQKNQNYFLFYDLDLFSFIEDNKNWAILTKVIETVYAAAFIKNHIPETQIWLVNSKSPKLNIVFSFLKKDELLKDLSSLKDFLTIKKPEILEAGEKVVLISISSEDERWGLLIFEE